MSKHIFNYQWYLKDGYDVEGIEKHNSKVFGTFVCGGGSAMGYKLAGYDDLGGVELDPKVAAIFKENLNPKYLYVEDIRDFNMREDLPDELYDLDLLDGSPPCSTFSTAGKREEGWNKAKKFAEGQKLQRLDDLVFVYCDTIKKLKPKVCLLENVSGLVKGNARAYAKQIIEKMTEAGYRTQLFLLNAAKMGVPQTRQRVFFIGLRNDFNLPKLKLDFNEEPITFGEFRDTKATENQLTENDYSIWRERERRDVSFRDTLIRTKGISGKFFTHTYIREQNVPHTIDTKAAQYDYESPRKLNVREFTQISSFPLDYKAPEKKKVWLYGMSVPPVMTAQIANQIWIQWLSKIKEAK